MTTASSTTMTTSPTQGAYTNEVMPAMLRVRKISCGAYATLERASEANTGNATRLGSRVWPRLSLRNGRPTTRRLAAVENFDTGSERMPSPCVMPVDLG
jgi:hypothetical protein